MGVVTLMVGFTHIQQERPLRSPAYTWFIAALFNLLAAAIIGIILRYAFLYGISWLNYKPWQDAHAHLALLGWGYQALFAGITAIYYKPGMRLNPFRFLFWAGQILILFITLNFILSGARMTANILLCLFSACIFIFAVFIRKYLVPHHDIRDIPLRLLRQAMIFLVISFAGIYMLIPVMLASGAEKLIWYYLCIQFFLHFQYNGWFVFAVLAMLFKLAADKGYTPVPTTFNRFFYLTLAGTYLSFFLSMYWGYQDQFGWLWIAAAGGFILIAGLIAGWSLFKNIYQQLLPKLLPVVRMLFMISAACYLVKLFMQVIIVVPDLAYLAFTIRNYVIAFLHLVFIGFMSTAVLGFAFQYNILRENSIAKAGIYVLLTGFVFMELVLFIQGTMQWSGFGFMKLYYHYVFYSSVFIPAGIILLMTGSLRRSLKT